MKKFFYLLLLTGILFTSCNGPTAEPHPGDYYQKVKTSSIVYTKDKRSGLCFGTVTSTNYPDNPVNSITCVPCDSVKNLIDGGGN